MHASLSEANHDLIAGATMASGPRFLDSGPAGFSSIDSHRWLNNSSWERIEHKMTSSIRLQTVSKEYNSNLHRFTNDVTQLHYEELPRYR